MCLILIGLNPGPGISLVVAANRDEYFDRPSAPATRWEDAGHVIAGRDLRHGGTWMGVTGEGRFAAVANFRSGKHKADAPRSRGLLAGEFLRGTDGPRAYLESVRRDRHAYGPFNLLVGDAHTAWLLSSPEDICRELPQGMHGISNGRPDGQWPKVRRGCEMMAKALEGSAPGQRERLFTVLADRVLPADGELPDTGVGLPRERLLAPIFVCAGAFGTRSSTVLIIHDDGQANFEERIFDSAARQKDRAKFAFSTRHGS